MLKFVAGPAASSTRPPSGTSRTRIETSPACAGVGRTSAANAAARRSFFIGAARPYRRTVPQRGFALKVGPPLANTILTVDETAALRSVPGCGPRCRRAAARRSGRRATPCPCDPLRHRREPRHPGLGQPPAEPGGEQRLRSRRARARYAGRARGVDAEDRGAGAFAADPRDRLRRAEWGEGRVRGRL